MNLSGFVMRFYRVLINRLVIETKGEIIMSLVINTNIASLMAQRNLMINRQSLTSSMEKLSSGYKINSASDDAAGLAISETLTAQINGNSQALSNIQNGINMLQIAEGSLSVINSNIQRIRELCIQAANDTNGTSEKNAILTEINQRLLDINRIANTTTFNSINLLNGSSTTCVLQIGASSSSTNTINIGSVLTNCTLGALSMSLSISGNLWTSAKIRSYLSSLDTGLNAILSKRSDIGALENRLQSALSNLSGVNNNLQSSESNIKDVDIANESSNMTKYQILPQASETVLAQANKLPQLALNLLNG